MQKRTLMTLSFTADLALAGCSSLLVAPAQNSSDQMQNASARAQEAVLFLPSGMMRTQRI